MREPPTGTVEFFDGLTDLGPGTMAAGVATLTTAALAAGSHSITGVYSGDGNFTTSTSMVVMQVVGQSTTTTGLTSAPNPTVFGQTVTLTATVTPVAPGAGIPTGTVEFVDGPTDLGSGTLAGGVATLTTSILPVGEADQLTAIYGGDANFSSSTSPVDSQTVNQASTTSTVTSSGSPSVFGQSVTFTDTIAAVAPGAGTATGTASFFDGPTLIGTGTLAGGVATFATSTLFVASHSITAVYSGDGNFTGSTSPVLTQVVSQATTTTTLTSSVNPSVFGQSVTFTATVSPTPPGGGTPISSTVHFFDGATSLAIVPTAGGVATFTTSALAVGSHPITGVFNGNGSFATSTSPVVTQVVNKATTTSTLTSSASPSVFGQSVTFTDTVAAAAPGAGTPTGSVEFFDGLTDLGPGTIAAGVATFATAALDAGSHSIIGVYSGDASFTTSTSPVVMQVVGQSTTTIGLTSSPNPSVFGQTVTLTATVTPVDPGAGIPTGTVEFFDGATDLGPGTLSGGVATLTTTALPAVAPASLTAIYGGDANFSGSTSPVDSQTINQASTTSTVTSSGSPSVFGQSVTFTDTITAVPPGGGTATGTATFFDGMIAIGTNPLVGGAATFTTSALSTASHSITAVYNGDANFTGSTSPAVTQVVGHAGTTTTLISSANPTVFGQSVTFTATVTPTAPGGGAPAGAVQFFDGATSLGFGDMAGGVGTITTSSLTVGSHPITALYSGDADFTSSTSAILTQVVNDAATTTTVTSSASPSAFGQAVTFTATVAPIAPGAGSPTGTVEFFDGLADLGPGTISGGVATLTTSALAVASHSITGVYSGDGSFTGSTSPILTQVVSQATTTTAVTSSASPAAFGESVTFTATVSPTAPGAGTPTGSVDFFDGATDLGVGVISGGVATFATSILDVGSHSITARYNGDSSFIGSTSAALTQVVSQATTTTTVTSSPSPSVFGQSVTLTATVAAALPGAGTPTGSVEFFDGATDLGSGALTSGVATLSTSALAVGASHSITAEYSGDLDFAGSTSPASIETVGQAATTASVASSIIPSLFGQPVTFTAIVAATPPGAGTPTGTVDFLDGAIIIGTSSLNDGAATFTTSALGATSHAITVVYAGDASFTGSTSTVLTQVVNAAPTTSAVTSSVNPSAAGQAVTFTDTVSPVSPGAGIPTGTVQFFDGATSLGAGALIGGAATFTTSTLSSSTHAITAVYAGDVNFGGSTSPVFTQVLHETTTTALISSSNPSVFGETVTFTAVVSAGVGADTPTGTVQFFDGALSLGIRTLGGGTATLSISTLAVNSSHPITAVYSADSGFFGGSTSLVVTQAVNQASSAGSIASSVNPSASGQSVTFSTVVSPVLPGAGLPTGSVEFLDGVTILGTVALGGGSASFTTSALPAASHSITVEYSGDANFLGVTSPVLTQVVNAGVTTTSLSASANPAAFGTSVVFTSHVAVVAPGSGVATGTVQFSSDGSPIGAITLDGSGNASLSISTLAIGSHAITAVYSGSATLTASAAAPITQVVNSLPVGDFDGDGLADPATLDTRTSTFYIQESSDGVQVIQFGQGTLYGGNPINVSAAYGTDGITDPAVFQASTSTFYIHTSTRDYAIQVGVGTNAGGNPIPVPGDYQGDGIIDPAVFDARTATWYIATQQAVNVTIQFGQGTLYGGNPVPVPAKYQGAGDTDLAVFQPSTSTYSIMKQSAPNVAVQIGIGTNAGGKPIPVSANYEGNGTIDPAVFEPSTATWTIAQQGGTKLTVQFGQGTLYGGHPVPVPANYPGAGQTDLAVFEPSTSTFNIQKHVALNAKVQIGVGTLSGGAPVVSPADFEGDGVTDPATFEPSTSTFFIARHNASNEAVQIGVGTSIGGHPVPITTPLASVASVAVITTRAAAPGLIAADLGVAADGPVTAIAAAPAVSPAMLSAQPIVIARISSKVMGHATAVAAGRVAAGLKGDIQSEIHSALVRPMNRLPSAFRRPR